MLSREQIYTMLKIRNRSNSIFPKLPLEMIIKITDCGQNPNHEFSIALNNAAYGKLAELKKMLDENPRLVLMAGTVVTPGGLTVERTTLLECAIFSGDPEMAEMIMPYYDQFEGGTLLKKEQLDKCQPHIEVMAKQLQSHQPSYDLKSLFDIVKQASHADITAALNSDNSHQSVLSDALNAFRTAVKPKKKTVGTHYEHYITIIDSACLPLGDHDDEDESTEWLKLTENQTYYDRCYLILRQIFGYLQRSLPAIDRFTFARAFQDQERTFKLLDNPSFSFPEMPDDKSGQLKLGHDTAIVGDLLDTINTDNFDHLFMACYWEFKTKCEEKISKLQALCRQDHVQERPKV